MTRTEPCASGPAVEYAGPWAPMPRDPYGPLSRVPTDPPHTPQHRRPLQASRPPVPEYRGPVESVRAPAPGPGAVEPEPLPEYRRPVAEGRPPTPAPGYGDPGAPSLPPEYRRPVAAGRHAPPVGDHRTGAPLGPAPETAVVESRMPEPAGPADRAALVRTGLLVSAAVTVAVGYVGLPLALAAGALLGALPQALVLAGALVVLATVGVLTVLQRTTMVLRPSGRRHQPVAHRPAVRTAPPDRRALPHAGPSGPGPRRPSAPHRPAHVPTIADHSEPVPAAHRPGPDAAGRHRTTSRRARR